MPLSELFATLAPFFNGAGVALVFAGLFIWLFLDTRKEQTSREQQVRADSAAREKVVRDDHETEQAKSDAREAWFRGTVEKSQITEAALADSLRRILEKMDTMDKRWERIETIITSRDLLPRKGT